jgi:hypothetical protein
MTAPEIKAQELVSKFGEELAIEVIDEIMQTLKFTEVAGNRQYLGYWSDIKDEINKTK